MTIIQKDIISSDCRAMVINRICLVNGLHTRKLIQTELYNGLWIVSHGDYVKLLKYSTEFVSWCPTKESAL